MKLHTTTVNQDKSCVLRPTSLSWSRDAVRTAVNDLASRSVSGSAARRARPRVPHVMLKVARSLVVSVWAGHVVWDISKLGPRQKVRSQGTYKAAGARCEGMAQDGEDEEGEEEEEETGTDEENKESFQTHMQVPSSAIARMSKRRKSFLLTEELLETMESISRRRL